jgi:hypothetical protein
VQLRHADGRGTTVPVHKGRDISPTLLRQISKDIGLSVEALLTGQPNQQPNKALQPTAGAANEPPPDTESGPG